MRRVMLLGVVVFVSHVLPAQQVDTHSIPAKSRYSLESFVGKKPLTRAERTNFTETSHYDDVVVFIDSLKKLGARISTGSIAKTSEGRDLPYVIASRPLVAAWNALERKPNDAHTIASVTIANTAVTPANTAS